MFFDGLNDVDLEASLRTREYRTPDPLRSLIRDVDVKIQIFAIYIDNLLEREWSVWWKSWKIRKLRLERWIKSKQRRIIPWLQRTRLCLSDKWKRHKLWVKGKAK